VLPIQWRVQSREQIKITWLRSEEYGGSSSVTALFFAKKSSNKTDSCAGALSSRRYQLLFLYVSGLFLLKTSLRRWRMSMYIFLFTEATAVNYTSQFQELFKATMYCYLLLCHWLQSNINFIPDLRNCSSLS
jgi:hypothetical protein